MTTEEKRLIRRIELAIEEHYGNKILRNYLEAMIRDIEIGVSDLSLQHFEFWLKAHLDENY